MPNQTPEDERRAIEQRAQEARHTRRSLSLSKSRIHVALSTPCPACGASRRTYCIPRAHGFCKARWFNTAA